MPEAHWSSDGTGGPEDRPEETAEPGSPARPSRRRVTAEDLERRWDDRRKGARARRTPERHRARRNLGIVVVSGLVVAACATAGVRSHDSFRTASAAQSSSISSLQAEVRTTPSAAARASVDPSALDALSEKASAVAQRVAAAQQRFQALVHTADADERAHSGNGAPDAASKALVNHRRDLAGYWDRSSLVVPDSLAYRFTTESVYDETERIDPRYPWYIRYDGSAVSAASASTWRVDAVAPRGTSARTADVDWSCVDSAGDVLAWASAIYTASTGRLSDLSLTVSASGEQHAGQAGQQTTVDPSRAAGTDPDLQDNKVPGYNAPSASATATGGRR